MADPQPSSAPEPIDPRTISTPEEFVEALTMLRARSGLTVRELGRAADIPGSTIGGYLSGRHLPPPTRPEVLGRLLAALGVPGPQHPAWAEMLHRVYAWRLPKDLSGQRPFLGLEAFDRADAELYFGRTEDVEALRDVVEASPGGIVAVLGASGSGKTSMLRAGLLPTLTEHWAVTLATPGADPERSISRAVGELETEQARDGGRRRLLVLDQAEELWTRHGTDESGGADRRRRSLAALRAFAGDPGNTVIVSLRSDFYAAAAEEPDLIDALRSKAFLLGPLTDAGIASIITGPAEVFGIALTPGLVDQMTSDARAGTADRAAVLPHLSHTLARMWERNPRRELTVEDYQAVGRIVGAVAQSAAEAWEELPPSSRDAARRFLLGLVIVDDGLPPTAGAMGLSDLTSADEREILGHFVRHRLIVVDEATVRFAHEAILTAWSELAGWIDADRSRLALRRVVTREARAWDGAVRDPDLLLRGARLAAVRDWPADPDSALTLLESEFIAASAAATDSQAIAELRRHRRTRRLLGATSAFAVASVLASAGLVASRLAIATERDNALSREIAAEARYLSASDPFVSQQLDVAAFASADTLQARSMLLGASAAPLVTALRGPVGPRIVAASPGRQLLAVGGQMPTVRLYDTSADVPRLVAEVPAPTTSESGSSIFAIAFSPDGSRLALAGTAGLLRLLDLTDPAHPRPVGPDLTLPDNAEKLHTAFAATFTPDGRELLVGTSAAGVLRWAVPTDPARALVPLASVPVTGYVTGVAMTQAGTVAVTTDAGTVSLWSLGPTPAMLGHRDLGGYLSWVAAMGDNVYVTSRSLKAAYRIPVDGHGLGTPVAILQVGSWVNWVQPVPSRGLVAVGSSDHSLTLLTPDGGVVDRTDWPEAVTSIADLGGARLAIGLVDGETELRTTPLAAADAPTTGIFFATWSGDGRRLAIFPSSSHAEVRLWDTSSPLRPRPLSTLTGGSADAVPNGSGDISPDGRLVVAGTYTGALIGWDVTDPRSPKPAFTTKVTSANIEQLRFLDATHLVLASDDDTVRLVALGSGEAPTVTATFTGATGAVLNSAISPDGSLVAGGSIDGNARLYRVGQAAPVATIPDGGYVYAVAFTPDGHHLLVAGASKVVKVYDISTPSAPRLQQTLRGPTGTIYLVDVSRNGQIAAASLDGTVTIWRPSGSGYVLGDTLLGRTPLFGVDWSPDNRHLVAVGQLAHLAIWTTDPQEAEAAVCAATADPISRDQWAAVLPDQPYAPPCPRP